MSASAFSGQFRLLRRASRPFRAARYDNVALELCSVPGSTRRPGVSQRFPRASNVTVSCLIGEP